jgi:DNA-binding HxlR family transcriptional regulator
MTEARWKLVVDQQGVTIASDRFQFTATGPATGHDEHAADDAVLEAADAVLAESDQMEAIIAELQTWTRSTYGQFCGLSRALEVVGERWVMLIIRDLLISPKRFADLRRGLPRIPAETLTTRLKELEHTGIVQRREDADAEEVYELTEYGGELEDISHRLGLWGARLLGEPRPEDIFTPDALVTALRASFVPSKARDLRVGYELRFGELVIHARIDNGTLHAAAGALPEADLVIEPGPMLKALMAREVTPEQALQSGNMRLTGDPELLNRFVEVFYIPTGRSAPVA